MVPCSHPPAAAAIKRLGRCALLLLVVSCLAAAISLDGFVPLAPVASYTTAKDGIVVLCTDNSQVRFQVLAADLVRVRASFGQALPARDHSWAIAKSDWDTPPFSVREADGEILLSTAELEVAIHRAPLLVEFRDARTHHAINADQLPMMHNPSSGAVAAARRLGFEEHFYGLGEKAAHLDKRRGQFTMWNSDTPAYHEGTDPDLPEHPFLHRLAGWRVLRHLLRQQLSHSFRFRRQSAGFRRLLLRRRRDELLLLLGAVDPEDPGPLRRSYWPSAHAARSGRWAISRAAGVISLIRSPSRWSNVSRRRPAAGRAPSRHSLHERLPRFHLGSAALPRSHGIHRQAAEPRCKSSVHRRPRSQIPAACRALYIESRALRGLEPGVSFSG